MYSGLQEISETVESFKRGKGRGWQLGLRDIRSLLLMVPKFQEKTFC